MYTSSFLFVGYAKRINDVGSTWRNPLYALFLPSRPETLHAGKEYNKKKKRLFVLQLILVIGLNLLILIGLTD